MKKKMNTQNVSDEEAVPPAYVTHIFQV
jgi:hypothetical protein